MTNPENPHYESSDSNPEQNSDDTYEQDLFASLEFDAPDVATQKERLGVILGRFRDEWDQQGITGAAFVDALEDPSTIQHDPNISVHLTTVRHHLEESTREKQEIALSLYETKDEQTSLKLRIPLVTRDQDTSTGEWIGTPDYDDHIDLPQAELLANQVDELTALKEQGILPNLNEGHYTIHDPATAMTRLPSPALDPLRKYDER